MILQNKYVNHSKQISKGESGKKQIFIRYILYNEF